MPAPLRRAVDLHDARGLVGVGRGVVDERAHRRGFANGGDVRAARPDEGAGVARRDLERQGHVVLLRVPLARAEVRGGGGRVGGVLRAGPGPVVSAAMGSFFGGFIRTGTVGSAAGVRGIDERGRRFGLSFSGGVCGVAAVPVPDPAPLLLRRLGRGRGVRVGVRVVSASVENDSEPPGRILVVARGVDAVVERLRELGERASDGAHRPGHDQGAVGRERGGREADVVPRVPGDERDGGSERAAERGGKFLLLGRCVAPAALLLLRGRVPLPRRRGGRRRAQRVRLRPRDEEEQPRAGRVFVDVAELVPRESGPAQVEGRRARARRRGGAGEDHRARVRLGRGGRVAGEDVERAPGVARDLVGEGRGVRAGAGGAPSERLGAGDVGEGEPQARARDARRFGGRGVRWFRGGGGILPRRIRPRRRGVGVARGRGRVVQHLHRGSLPRIARRRHRIRRGHAEREPARGSGSAPRGCDSDATRAAVPSADARA